VIITFDPRYTEELHPYKYAGYPMLIKTIMMETDDDKVSILFISISAEKLKTIYFVLHFLDKVSSKTYAHYKVDLLKETIFGMNFTKSNKIQPLSKF
jgi:hypothetical protein